MLSPTSFIALATTYLLGLLLADQVSAVGIHAEALSSKWTHFTSKAELVGSSLSSKLLGTQIAYVRMTATSGATRASIATVTNTGLSPSPFTTTTIDGSTVTSDAAILATLDVDTTKICPTTFVTSTRYDTLILAKMAQEVIEVEVTAIEYKAPILTFVKTATISETTAISVMITTIPFVCGQTSTVTSIGITSSTAPDTIHRRDLESYQQDLPSPSTVPSPSPVDNQPFGSHPRPGKSHDEPPPSQPKPTKSHTKHKDPLFSQSKSTKSHSLHVATPSFLNPLPEESSELQGRHPKIPTVDISSTSYSKKGDNSSDAYHSNEFRCSEDEGEGCSRLERKKMIPRHPPDHSGSDNSTSSSGEGSSHGPNGSKEPKGPKSSKGTKGSKESGSESGGSESGPGSKSGSGSESGGSESGSGSQRYLIP